MNDRDEPKLAYGPVPSRRLGQSLGVNNIPPKMCTYACVYCQVGRTTRCTIDPQPCYLPSTLVSAVRHKVAQAARSGEQIDYLTFVPDGEPTLDAALGDEIAALKTLGTPVAVITNGSLIWRDEVQAALMQADWVSLKVDAVRPEIWQKINRPHRQLRLARILEGMAEFAATYDGTLVTETMLVADVNDDTDHLTELGDRVARLHPHTAYLSVPIRPPTEDWVRIPDGAALNRAYQVLHERVDRLEYLIGYEGNQFALTGDVTQDILGITAVHPMREDAVQDMLARAGSDWSTVQTLVAQGQLQETHYQGHHFYLRTFHQDTR
jgi:wyosine [tRNA(Phe)-imidazoG37] synthetase (radical SAM superfamily)